jgi:hypothetical protein
MGSSRRGEDASANMDALERSAERRMRTTEIFTFSVSEKCGSYNNEFLINPITLSAVGASVHLKTGASAARIAIRGPFVGAFPKGLHAFERVRC